MHSCGYTVNLLDNLTFFLEKELKGAALLICTDSHFSPCRLSQISTPFFRILGLCWASGVFHGVSFTVLYCGNIWDTLRGVWLWRHEKQAKFSISFLYSSNKDFSLVD